MDDVSPEKSADEEASTPDEALLGSGEREPEPIYIVRATLRERLVSVLLVLCFAGVSLLAHRMRVDPSGTGSHTQLGLPPCGLYDKFGIPCMSCGWTTAWAAITKMRVVEALAASPFGAVLWAVLAAGAAASAWSALSGWPFFRFIERLDWVRIGLATLALMTASWTFKIVVCLI